MFDIYIYIYIYIDRKIHAPEFVKPAPEMEIFFRNSKEYFIFGNMLPK